MLTYTTPGAAANPRREGNFRIQFDSGRYEENKLANELIKKRGRKMEKQNNVFKNIKEIANGKESGIVIYDDCKMIICNWSSFNGMPYVYFDQWVDGANEDIELDCEPEKTKDISKYLINKYGEGSLELFWDANKDIDNLDGIPGTIYHVNDGTVIIAPDGWN